MKVTYLSRSGWPSKAYLDDEPTARMDGYAVFEGTDKYTDEPVSAYWDEYEKSWVEVS